MDYQPPAPPSPDWDLRVYRRITCAFLLSAAAIVAVVALLWPHHPSLWAIAAGLAIAGIAAPFAS